MKVINSVYYVTLIQGDFNMLSSCEQIAKTANELILGHSGIKWRPQAAAFQITLSADNAVTNISLDVTKATPKINGPFRDRLGLHQSYWKEKVGLIAVRNMSDIVSIENGRSVYPGVQCHDYYWYSVALNSSSMTTDAFIARMIDRKEALQDLIVSIWKKYSPSDIKDLAPRIPLMEQRLPQPAARA